MKVSYIRVLQWIFTCVVTLLHAIEPITITLLKESEYRWYVCIPIFVHCSVALIIPQYLQANRSTDAIPSEECGWMDRDVPEGVVPPRESPRKYLDGAAGMLNAPSSVGCLLFFPSSLNCSLDKLCCGWQSCHYLFGGPFYILVFWTRAWCFLYRAGLLAFFFFWLS